MDLAIKIIMLVVFFGSMIGIGIYCCKHSTNVDGFVLGGRNVGPWLTAFAYGTSYFSAVAFVTMSMVKHGDNRPEKKKTVLENFDVED